MREFLEVLLSFVSSALASIYILLFILQEHEMLRFVFAEFFMTFAIFSVLMWLFELAKTRDKRKEKLKKRRTQNEIRETNSRRD